MKAGIKLSLILTMFVLTFSFKTMNAQAIEKKTESFKVYGNCEMCQETIEGALKKKDGVIKKEWSTKTKMMTVTYDPSIITLTQIKKKIADAGYDTEEIQAKDESYKNLHKCCQYDRFKKSK